MEHRTDVIDILEAVLFWVRFHYPHEIRSNKNKSNSLSWQRCRKLTGNVAELTRFAVRENI